MSRFDSALSCGASYTQPLPPPKRVGDSINWRPQAWFDTDAPWAAKELNGRVIYVNAAHRYYTAEAIIGGRPLRESFRY